MDKYSEQEMARRTRVGNIATVIVLLVTMIVCIIFLVCVDPQTEFFGRPIIGLVAFMIQLFIVIPFHMWRGWYLNDKKLFRSWGIFFAVACTIFLFMIWKTWKG